MPASVQIYSVMNWDGMGPPSQRVRLLLWAVNGWLFSARKNAGENLQKQTALVRAELYQAGISAKDDAVQRARITRETMRYNRELSEQGGAGYDWGAQRRKMQRDCQLCHVRWGA